PLGERLTEYLDLAARRAGEPEQHLHGRRLAGPVRPQEAVDHPARYPQVERIDRGVVAELLGQGPGRDGGAHRGSVPSIITPPRITGHRRRRIVPRYGNAGRPTSYRGTSRGLGCPASLGRRGRPPADDARRPAAPPPAGPPAPGGRPG